MTSATQLLGHIIDPGSFQPWDAEPGPEPDPDYRSALARARQRSGHDEAVLTGQARINGTAVALVLGNFDFLGGSVGHVAAYRIRAAVDRATRSRFPLLASPASGGTRMQEGTPAFVHMRTICAALAAHRDAGLPYLVYLRHPTFGGVMASWGSMGQITLAEPGASLGFLGPKVFEAVTGRPFPSGIQTAEHLRDVRLVDDVVDPRALRPVVIRILKILNSRSDPQLSAPATGTVSDGVRLTAGECLRATRAAAYPRFDDFLPVLSRDFHPLNAAAGQPVTVGLGTVRSGQPCVIIGQNRRSNRPDVDPAALRLARRGIDLARNLRLPIVTVVDTAGGELSPGAEEGGLCREIARCTEQLTTHPQPTVTVLLGQGTGGAALALLGSDRVVALDCAWLSPLPPEGASTILYGDTTHALRVADAQRVGAGQLREDGIVDVLVDSNGGQPGVTELRALAAAASDMLQARAGGVDAKAS